MDEQQKMLERYKERLNKCVTMSKKLLIERVGVNMNLHKYVCLIWDTSVVQCENQRSQFMHVSIARM